MAQEYWKIIFSGGIFVVVDSRGTQITTHHDMWKAVEHAKEIARVRELEVELSGSFRMSL